MDAPFALWQITADLNYLALLLQGLPRSDVIYRLSWGGAVAVPRLEKALDSTNAPVREIGLRGLAFMGEKADPAAIEIARLLKDPNRSVRLASAAALRQIGPNRRQAVPGLIEALKDPISDDQFPRPTWDPLNTGRPSLLNTAFRETR